MDKVIKILAKIENARMHLDASKEVIYRKQLNMLLEKKTFSDEERIHIKNYWDEMDARTLNHAKSYLQTYIARSEAKIMVNEQVYDMKHWCTVSQYAKIHGYKNTEAISNKIRRGVIRAENVAYIPELDIKLIRI